MLGRILLFFFARVLGALKRFTRSLVLGILSSDRLIIKFSDQYLGVPLRKAYGSGYPLYSSPAKSAGSGVPLLSFTRKAELPR
jgi:hypothetical protein